MTEDEFKHDDENYGRELDRREELEREDIILHDPTALVLPARPTRRGDRLPPSRICRAGRWLTLADRDCNRGWWRRMDR